MRLAGAMLVATLAQACVGSDAGYQDVRRGVLARTGHDAKWRHIDGGSDAERRTRELLAKPLDVDAAVQVALHNNPEVQAAFEELGLARASVVEAFHLPNPSVEGALHFHGEGEPDIDVAVMANLTDLLFLPSRNAAARAELDSAKLGVLGQLMDLILQVRVAFYRYQAASQIVDLRRTVVLAAKGSFDAARGLHEAGNITDLDLANEQALYEEARLAVAQSESELVTERERLTAAMGLWGRQGFQTTERLPDPPERDIDAHDVERKALAQSIDLDLARKRYAAAAKRANLARAEGFLPELKAGASFERDEGDWGVGPAAELEVPLFYQGQGAVDRARAQMRQNASRHASLAVQIRTAARASANRLVNARERALYYRRVLIPLRERIVQETQLQFNAMNVGVFQLLTAKRDEIETGRAYVEALRDYWIARAEIAQLLAGRLVRSATEPMPSNEPRTPARADRH